MSPGRRRVGLLTAALLLASAGSVPAGAGAAAPDVPAPTPKVAWTARIVATAGVFGAPGGDGRPRGRVSPVAKWNGGIVRLLVLESRRDEADGRLWLRVALPDRPNGRSGWIDADLAQLAPVRWRVEVDLAQRRASAFHDGRRVRSWPVVIGRRATPTPRGPFAVYERVRQPPGSELGSYALHVTAHSEVLFDYGGGRGRVALHGRAGPLLADPLGSARSNGCVRMDDRIATWLAARAAPGTPVLVR